MRLLLVEDELRAAQILAKGLREEAYAVDVAPDGERAVYQASISDFDAIILDIGLPGSNGFDVCRQLRDLGLQIPILMLTGRDAIEARVQGLDSGADDYLTKPFDFRELLARLRALLRRGQRPVTPAVLTAGPLSVDTRARQVRRDGQLIELTAREYALLEYLVLNMNAVVGRAALTEHVWEAMQEPASNAVDVCVQRLRRKIDTHGQPSLILTRRGEGYMLSSIAPAMMWSIRTRLTAWYSGVVVVVLVSGTLVVDVIQERVMLQRLDADLGRLMSTLQGVMRTEFNEGLDIQAAADEASIEVLAPGRTLVLTQPDGKVLARWGEPIDAGWQPMLTRTVQETVDIGGVPMRVASERVTYRAHDYIAAVMGPMREVDDANAELRRTLGFGALVALALAALGGWLISRQVLRPLDTMASQAIAITGQTGVDRLSTPNPQDELGKLATAFNGLLDRLAHTLHAQRQFMADASHELRSPVSVVRATAQITLGRDTRSTDEYREMMTIVGEQAERLTRLVDAMFLLSRAEADGLPLVPEPVYIDDIVTESARALRVLAAERDVTVVVDGQTAVSFVGDNRLLRQMTSNVIDNAVRHARQRGAVWVTIRRDAEGIGIAVVDDGPGVPPEAHSLIFQRFARLNSHYSGAGLGLPIARWIAEAHGGRLEIEASGPGGSTFTITLPSARRKSEILSPNP